MRSSVLSGVAFLACGLLVFGRPLSTRQEGAGLTLPYNIASTLVPSPNALNLYAAYHEDQTNVNAYPSNAFISPEDSQQNTYPKVAFSSLDTSPVSSPEVPDSDAFLKNLAVSSQFGPGTSLKSDISSANVPDTNFNTGSTSVQKQPETFASTLEPITPSSMTPSLEIALLLPEDFQDDLTGMKAQYGGYCFYGLSQGDGKLVRKECAHDGKFKQVYQASFPPQASSPALAFFYYYNALFYFCNPGEVQGLCDTVDAQLRPSIREEFQNTPIIWILPHTSLKDAESQYKINFQIPQPSN